MVNTNEPEKRLSKDSVKVWLLEEALSTLLILIIFAIVFFLDNRFEWKVWIHWIIIVAFVGFLCSFIYSFIRPFFLYKNWRYDVSSEYLQLKWGFISETHEIIPMTKIQAVSTKQGPLLRKYGLCQVTVDTMGTSHSIPSLPKEEAIHLRNKIVKYAKIKETEQ